MRPSFVAALLLVACNTPAPEQPADAAPMASADAASATELGGMVAETMDAAGYTYVHLQTKGGMKWAAVEQTSLKPGDRVQITDFTWMKGFHSNTLDRTFDEIAFGRLARAGGANPHLPGAGASNPHAPGDVAPPQQMSEGDADAMMAAHGTAAAKAVDDAIAKPAGGHSVAEVWAGKAGLAGKPVTVRGKVVKFTSGVMGSNWIHIQDGSGSASANDHDLTVTTLDNATIGDVVTVSGTVVTDKDFGAGYRYDVLVENAKLAR